MKYIYQFDDESIPFWIKALFYVLYLIPSLYFCYKLILDKKRYTPSSITIGFFLLYFTLFAVFYCVGTDYFRYRDWIQGRDFSFWGKERFYIYVILFCQNLPFEYPFEVFRLIVWGGAVFIAYHTFRMYREWLLPGIILLLLFVFQAGTFSYARASLAMAVYFIGIALYCTN